MEKLEHRLLAVFAIAAFALFLIIAHMGIERRRDERLHDAIQRRFLSLELQQDQHTQQIVRLQFEVRRLDKEAKER